MRVVCVFFGEATSHAAAFAEACLRLTPQVALAKKCIFLEVGACKNIYSEAAVRARLMVLLKRFNLKARMTVGEDIPTALALATAASASAKHELPIDVLPIYANPFGESRALDMAVILLKSLGVRTLENFLKLPRKDLASRFGKEALLALHYIETAAHMPWPYFAPQEKICETRFVDDSYLIRELEPVLFLLRGLLDRCLLRLRGRGQLAQTFSIRILQENYSTVAKPERLWTIELSFAVGSTLSLLSMVRDRMNFDLEREPFVAPITQIDVEILKSVPSQGRQTDFFSKKEEEAEQFQTVVARLIDRLGIDRAFMARAVESYTPEKSWRKTFDLSPCKPQIPLPLRPLRVLRKPQPLKKIENYFWLADTPGPRRKWLALELLGPERLSGEWWMESTPERDYYRVITDSGEELWVYQIAGQNEYFLHGVFD